MRLGLVVRRDRLIGGGSGRQQSVFRFLWWLSSAGEAQTSPTRVIVGGSGRHIGEAQTAVEKQEKVMLHLINLYDHYYLLQLVAVLAVVGIGE